MLALVMFTIAFGPPTLLAILLAALFAPELRGVLRRRLATGFGRLALGLAIVGLVLAPVMAFAQGAVVPVDAGPGWFQLLQFVLASIFVGVVAWGLRRYLGIELDRTALDNLHLAAETGAAAVAVRLGVRSAVLDPAAVKDVVSHIRASVPDALARLAPSDEVLANIALKKLAGAAAPLRAVEG